MPTPTSFFAPRDDNGSFGPVLLIGASSYLPFKKHPTRSGGMFVVIGSVCR